MRQRFPGAPQPWVERHTSVSRARNRAASMAAGSSGRGARSGSPSSRASKAIPRAPMVPGFGGTTTVAPVWRATAAASASELKGIPWQKTRRPTVRGPLTRFR